MTIREKLTTIQTEMKCNKSQYNKFGGYYYRSCEDIQEAIKPFLNRLGASLVVSDNLENLGERYYVKATATLFDNETGESIASTSYAREDESQKGMSASQVTGSASSYARKYALNGLLCIDDVKDADATNDHDKGATTSEPKKQQPKDTSSEAPQTDPLVQTIKKITEIATKLYSGDKKEKVITLVKKYSDSGNPNAIKDMESAKKLYTEIIALEKE